MQRLSRDRYITSFSKRHPPAYEVEPDEVFLVETWDCWGGRPKDQRPPELANPATGPIVVKGARPGQVLEISILEVAPESRGFVSAEGTTKHVELVDGFALFSDTLKLPLTPMIGVVGVAPAEGELPCTHPGDHGGNLDTTDVCAGAKLYLPVQVEGAGLGLGDVHACQGDGEVSGQGIEVGAEVILRVAIGEAPLVPRPYVVRGSRFITIASAPTFEEAIDACVEDMIGVLGAKIGLARPEARMLISLCGHVRVSQIVNPLMTARVEMPILW